MKVGSVVLTLPQVEEPPWILFSVYTLDSHGNCRAGIMAVDSESRILYFTSASLFSEVNLCNHVHSSLLAMVNA